MKRFVSRGLSSQAKRICSNNILPATDHRSWAPDGAVTLQMQESGPHSRQPISIPTMFSNTVDNHPGHLALHTRDQNGQDVKWTYEQYMQDVRTAAKGFIALGLERFHTVGILGYNSPEWVISHVASVHAGGFGMGIYQTNNAHACHYVSDHSRSNILVVEDRLQLEKILSIREKLPHLRQIIQYSGDLSGESGVMSWSQLMELGRSQTDQLLDERLSKISVNQCAGLCYTSGTTGNPKGVMCSHDTIVFGASETSTAHGWEHTKERVVSYLPLSHIAGMMFDIYYPISKAGSTCFADSNALKGTLIDNLKYYKPTRFLGVPRVWEKMEEKIKLAGKETKGLKRKVADWAKNEALQHNLRCDAGDDKERLGYKLAKKLVLSKIHEALGLDSVVKTICATGGAAISRDTHEFFLNLDIRLLEVYGSTESLGPQIQGLPFPGCNKLGTIGKVPLGLAEGKLFNLNERREGEICTRGRCTAMGYLFDKNKTLDTFDEEGWLHTGDLGSIDSDGFYSIVGRIKEIIITAGGENIAPVNIEEEIKKELENVVSNIMVVGEKRRFLSCLITLKVKPDPDTLAPTSQLEDLAKDWIFGVTGVKLDTVPEVIDLLQSDDDAGFKLARAIDEGISKANKMAISRAATVQKWSIVPREFSVATGELSPSLKTKRFAVHEMYKKLIDEMYLHEGHTSVAW